MKRVFLSIGLVSMIIVPVVVVVTVVPQQKVKGSNIVPNRAVKEIYLTNVKALSKIEEISKLTNLSNRDIQKKLSESQPLISNASLDQPMAKVVEKFKGHKIHDSIKYTFENKDKYLPHQNKISSFQDTYTFNRVMDTMLNIEKNHEDVVASDKEKELLEASYRVKKHILK